MIATPALSEGLTLLVVSNMWPSEEHPVYGGFVARNVEALRELGAHVDVVANSDSRTGTLAAVKKYAVLSRRVRDHVSGRSYDAVIGHYLYPTAAMAHSAARLTGAGLVLVVHGTDACSVLRRDPWARAARRAARSADLVITVSQALAETVRTGLRLSKDVPVVTVHMGIDERVFVPDSEARSCLGVAKTERVVLFVGNLVKIKGLDVLGPAFEMLRAAKAADRLVIVGDGPLAAGLRTWSEHDPELRGRVTITGRIEQAEVARWMAAADVLALPSYNEGLGLVLLEAMACGTPCVASRVGGVPEIMSDSTGLLVPPGDPRALATALACVLERGRDSYRQDCIDAASGHGTRAMAEKMLLAIEEVRFGG